MERRTIRKTIQIQGTGLHRGQKITLHLRPLESGIVFIREGIRIPATPESIVDTRLNTTIGSGGVTISTIEHLMSAFYGLGITDCEIEVDGDEIPAMDGSALPFMQHIKDAGTKVLGKVQSVMIPSPMRVSHGDAWVEASPGSFCIEYGIDFPEPAIGKQAYTFSGNGFEAEIAPARTFGRLSEVDMMRSMGLALGGNLRNAVVVDGNAILNPEGLRFQDEFIRHKVLDILGDLWTIGRPVVGLLRAYKANHSLHITLAKKIYALIKA
jgi:UDP-3-O-[3-hydroxymyristoyl] N-acetylglucosamine deacetylase